MRQLEMVILAFVVVHSALHMPREIKDGWTWVRDFLRRYLGDGPYPNSLRLAVAVAMALATAVSMSPPIYYGLECCVRFFGAPEASVS